MHARCNIEDKATLHEGRVEGERRIALPQARCRKGLDQSRIALGERIRQ